MWLVVLLDALPSKPYLASRKRELLIISKFNDDCSLTRRRRNLKILHEVPILVQKLQRVPSIRTRISEVDRYLYFEKKKNGQTSRKRSCGHPLV